MNTDDQGKLLDAGFTIIRAELHNANGAIRIKAKTAKCSEWYTYEKDFKNKTQLLNRMKELLKSSLIIED